MTERSGAVVERGVASEPCKVVAGVALAVLLNLLAVLIEMVVLVGKDGRGADDDGSVMGAWTSFAVALWVQSILNGAVLIAWPKTFRIGLGILIGTAATVFACAFWFWVVVP